MSRKVATVVDHDVERSVLLDQRGQERWVRLVTDSDIDAGLGQGCRSGIDVDPHDHRATTQVVPPHLQGTTVRDADLEHDGCRAPKASEVALVNVEIVIPFVDQAAIVVLEVPLQTASR